MKGPQSLSTSSISEKTLSKPAEPTDADKRSAPSSRAHTPSNTSHRNSSEGSYDWVSSTANSTAGEEKKGTAKAGRDDEDGDSDWE